MSLCWSGVPHMWLVVLETKLWFLGHGGLLVVQRVVLGGGGGGVVRLFFGLARRRSVPCLLGV